MPLNKKVARACYKRETKTLVDKWIKTTEIHCNVQYPAGTG